MIQARPSLSGKRILIVEDEYFIADDLAQDFEDTGAEIAGPAGSVEEALAILDSPGRLDGAVLDICVRGEMVFPVADMLIARGIPFLFATGYDVAAVPPEYRAVPRCEKPVAPAEVAKALLATQFGR